MDWDKSWHRCRTYAEDEFETVKKTRAQRGQTNPVRIKHQTAVGKMGELCACDHLRKLGFEVTDPDFTIYSGRKKSWESDMFLILPTGKFKVACKAQDEASAKRYGRSWIFQKGGMGYGHTDPVIQSGESLSVFVSVNLEAKMAEVRGPFRMCHLRPLFKPPRLENLRFSKVALYWEDMESVPVYGVEAEEASDKMSSKRQKVEPKKHMTYVLDRSGSMSQFGEEGYTGIQTAIEELGDSLVSIFTFDNYTEQVAEGVEAKGYVLPRESVKPRGMTALRDCISEALEYVGTLEGPRSVVIFTDGNDNVSKTSPQALAKMIKASKEAGVNISWLAAADAEMETAVDLGMDRRDVLKVGSSGQNMSAAMLISSQKSVEGFSDMQRATSVS